MIRFVVICLRKRVHYASPYERHTGEIGEDSSLIFAQYPQQSILF